MSWDVMIFNSTEKIDSLEDINEDKLEDFDFCAVFRKHFKNIKEENNLIEIKDNDYSISCFTDDKPVNHKLISIIGERGLYEVVELCKRYKLQIFDTELGEMIDLNNPERNGYKNFKDFVQHIINKE